MPTALDSRPLRTHSGATRPLVERLGPTHPVVRALGLGIGAAEPRPLPVAALDALWDALVEREGPAAPVRIATEIRASTYGLLTYLLGCAPSGHHAVRRLSTAYPALLSEGTRYRISADRRHVEVHVELVGPARSAGATIFATASVAGFVHNEVIGAPRPVQARLCDPPTDPSTLAALRSLFGDPITWVTDGPCLIYERAALERALRGSDPELAEVLEDAARRRLAAPQPAAEAVRAVLLSTTPPARNTQDEVAAAMGCSPRALRRRLAAEGTRFSEVVDAVRRDWAQAWLEQPGARVAELAPALGFADPAALRRAFRRWTGMSPSTWASLARSDHPGTTAVSDSTTSSTSSSSTVISTQLSTPSPVTSA